MVNCLVLEFFFSFSFFFHSDIVFFFYISKFVSLDHMHIHCLECLWISVTFWTCSSQNNLNEGLNWTCASELSQVQLLCSLPPQEQRGINNCHWRVTCVITIEIAWLQDNSIQFKIIQLVYSNALFI